MRACIVCPLVLIFFQPVIFLRASGRFLGRKKRVVFLQPHPLAFCLIDVPRAGLIFAILTNSRKNRGSMDRQQLV